MYNLTIEEMADEINKITTVDGLLRCLMVHKNTITGYHTNASLRISIINKAGELLYEREKEQKIDKELLNEKLDEVEEFIEKTTATDDEQKKSQLDEVKELLKENWGRKVTFLKTTNEPIWGWGDIEIKSSNIWKGKIENAPPLELYTMISFEPKLKGDDCFFH